MLEKHHSIIILDKSGSMGKIRESIISGVNEQIEEIEKIDKDAKESDLTMVVFSGTTQIQQFCQPTKRTNKLDSSSYKPSGSTAMYDAIGTVLKKFENEIPDDEDTRYLCVIVSDGEEWASKQFNQSVIAEMIQERQKTGRWTFVYLGSNQNLADIENINIPKANIANWDSESNIGVRRSLKQFRKATTAYTTSLGEVASSSSIEYFSGVGGIDKNGHTDLSIVPVEKGDIETTD